MRKKLETSMHEYKQNEEDYYWIADHNDHVAISFKDILYNIHMNLLILSEVYRISNLYVGLDTCFFLKSWNGFWT
jgi:hypothetical protein